MQKKAIRQQKKLKSCLVDDLSTLVGALSDYLDVELPFRNGNNSPIIE
jgi:hypothetical protein